MNVKDFLVKGFWAVLLIVVFVSCSDDEGGEPTPSTPYAVGLYVSVDLSEEILATADVYLQYIDSDGLQKLEKVTETYIRKTVVTRDFSQTLGYRILLMKKTSNNITAEALTMSCKDYSLFAVVDQDGNALSSKQINVVTSQTINKDKVNEWIAMNAKLRTEAYKVSDDKKNFEAVTFNWADVK